MATPFADADLQFAQSMENAGARVQILHGAGPLRRHADLARTLHEAALQSDALHVHGVWEEVQHAAASAARKAGKPYVWRSCGMLEARSLKQKALKKRIMLRGRVLRDINGASLLHFTSEREREETSLRLRPPHVIEPNGINLQEFAFASAFASSNNASQDAAHVRAELRARYELAPDAPIVLFLGRLHPIKSIDALLHAFGGAQEGSPLCRATLLLAGPNENNYRAHLETLVASLHLGERVRFLGALSGRDKIEALRGADVFALPSKQENFGNVVVESLAAGTPVVVSQGVALWEDVVAAKVGTSAEMQGDSVSVDALRRELEAWLHDKARRHEASGRAQAWARERFDWNLIAARWQKHYARLKARDGSQ